MAVLVISSTGRDLMFMGQKGLYMEKHMYLPVMTRKDWHSGTVTVGEADLNPSVGFLSLMCQIPKIRLQFLQGRLLKKIKLNIYSIYMFAYRRKACTLGTLLKKGVYLVIIVLVPDGSLIKCAGLPSVLYLFNLSIRGTLVVEAIYI
ncbi:hypothetical protein FKM82_016834 [Ascaphus truei]